MRNVLGVLLMFLLGCSEPRAKVSLSARDLDLSQVALNHMMQLIESQEAGKGFSVVVCPQNRAEPDDEFLKRFEGHAFSVLPCSSSARDNGLHELYLSATGRTQYELTSVIEAIADGKARVRVVFRNAPASAGFMLLELNHRAGNWTVTAVAAWGQT